MWRNTRKGDTTSGIHLESSNRYQYFLLQQTSWQYWTHKIKLNSTFRMEKNYPFVATETLSGSADGGLALEQSLQCSARGLKLPDFKERVDKALRRTVWI